MFLQKNNFFLYDFFGVFLFVCSIYLWSIKFGFIEARHLIILLIIPIIYNKKFNKGDFVIILVCSILFIHKILFIEGNKILESLLILFYLIILIKILKEYYKKFLTTLSSQINLFFILFILSSAITSLYFLYEHNIFYTHCLIGCFSMFNIFFLENSHLGMMSSSLILYTLYLHSIKDKKINFILFIIFLLICFLNYSLTFFLGLIFNCLFIFVFFWKYINRKYLIYLILTFILSSSIIVNNKGLFIKIQSAPELVKSMIKTDDKKNINNNQLKLTENNEKIIVYKNLSSDVWFKSVKIAFNAVPNYLLGVGLNNYEIAHNQFIYKVVTKFELTKKLNIQDASNNLMKIVVEFGLFSFFLFYLILKFIFSKKIELNYKIFLLPNIFTQLLFRGAGYFNGGFVIFIIVMTYLIYEKEID
tara:strand:+ start:318 stop:1571 length:1254 start_codon:yes stop_codon:yes gene_type:complete